MDDLGDATGDAQQRVERALTSADAEAKDRMGFEQAFGAAVQQVRAGLGMTAEAAAKRAGVAFKTWLRMEHGKPVRSMTFAGADELFGLPTGTVAGVWANGGDLGVLATGRPARRARASERSGRSGDPTIERAADAAPRALGEFIGDAVAVVLLDHSMDEHPDPNIHELAHCVLMLARLGGGE